MMNFSKEILLSVVIPSYNLKYCVKKCIDSILNQITDFEFDIFIVDDNSTDNTVEYLNHIYKKEIKVKIVKNEKNIGFFLNAKKCLNISNSKYICFLDVDDFLCDFNYLQKAVDFLEKNKNYSCYGGTYKYIYDDKSIMPDDDSFFISLKDEFKNEDFLETNQSIFARVIRNNYDFLDHINYRTEELHADWIVNYQITKNNEKIKCNSDCLTGYYHITFNGQLTGKTEIQSDHMFQKTKEHIKTLIKKEYVFIVPTYPKTKLAVELTKECINYLKSSNIDIILTTHYKIPLEISKLSNYFIYDDNNLNINTNDKSEGYSVFYDYPDFYCNFRIDENKLYHGPAVYIINYNGIHLSNLLKYKKSIIVDYDFKLTHECIDALIEKSKNFDGLFFTATDKNESIETNIFIINNEVFIKNFELIKTNEDYKSLINKNCIENGDIPELSLEKLYCKIIKNNNLNVLIEKTSDLESLSEKTNSKTNLVFRDSHLEIIPTNNDKNRICIFCKCRSNKSKLQIKINDEIYSIKNIINGFHYEIITNKFKKYKLEVSIIDELDEVSLKKEYNIDENFLNYLLTKKENVFYLKNENMSN